jgi:hypothetical protein
MLSPLEILARLKELSSPEVDESLSRLRERYGRRAGAAADVRAILDKALGSRSLTKELYKSRGA